MSSPKHIENTRQLVEYLSPKYVRGKTLDLGAGKTKYRPIFEKDCEEYVSCDSFEADHIDYKEDAHALSFPDNSFDTVICTMVFEHVPRPWDVAKEIQRVLRPGGHAIVTAPFMFPYHQDPEDYFRYSQSGMRSLFPQLDETELGGYRGFWGLVESCVRMTLVSPYKKKAGFIARNVYRVIAAVCNVLDRLMPTKEIYCETYFVGKKY